MLNVVVKVEFNEIQLVSWHVATTTHQPPAASVCYYVIRFALQGDMKRITYSRNVVAVETT